MIAVRSVSARSLIESVDKVQSGDQQWCSKEENRIYKLRSEGLLIRKHPSVPMIGETPAFPLLK